MKKSISVIIPVYKNTDLFVKNLTHNKKYLSGCEIIVSNDNPAENITKKVLVVTPHAYVMESFRNLGFGENVNRAVWKATNDFILLLNSDVVLSDTLYQNATTHFDKDPRLFAVSFAQKERDGKIVGGNAGRFEKGLLQHFGITRTQLEPNLWAEGGSMMCRRDMFMRLHGFDRLYAPFYWEDLDLSYRAWKSGHNILFDPKIVVEHHHESTIGKYFTPMKKDTIAYRNQFIFYWKNITDPLLLAAHLFFLPLTLARAMKDKNKALLQGFVQAIFKLPIILATRLHTTPAFSLTDREVLSRIKNE